MTDRTVKMDDELLKRVEKLISHKSKKLKYETRRQFINFAVIDLLEKEENLIAKNDNFNEKKR